MGVLALFGVASKRSTTNDESAIHRSSFVVPRSEVMMRLYYEIALRSFRRATAYRSAYIAGMLTNAFFGALRSFVFIALFAAGGRVAGFTLADAISYTWVTQSLISIGAGWIDSRDMMQTIR